MKIIRDLLNDKRYQTKVSIFEPFRDKESIILFWDKVIKKDLDYKIFTETSEEVFNVVGCIYTEDGPEDRSKIDETKVLNIL